VELGADVLALGRVMVAVWRQTCEVVGSLRRLSLLRRPSVQRTAKLVRVQARKVVAQPSPVTGYQAVVRPIWARVPEFLPVSFSTRVPAG